MQEAGIVQRVELVAQRLDSVVEMAGPIGNNGSFTVTGKIVREFDPKALSRWLRPLGKVTVDQKGGGAIICSRKGRFTSPSREN